MFQVLLEVLTGRRALEKDGKSGERYLVRTHTQFVVYLSAGLGRNQTGINRSTRVQAQYDKFLKCSHASV